MTLATIQPIDMTSIQLPISTSSIVLAVVGGVVVILLLLWPISVGFNLINKHYERLMISMGIVTTGQVNRSYNAIYKNLHGAVGNVGMKRAGMTREKVRRMKEYGHDDYFIHDYFARRSRRSPYDRPRRRRRSGSRR